MSAPVISIIIPAYKRPDLLLETVQSVNDQTYAGPVEIIVVDDESPVDLKTPLLERFPHVIYLRKSNGGCGPARQYGIEHAATGDLIAFNDDDDLFLPDKLQTQYELLTRHPQLDWCFHDCDKFTPEGDLEKTSFQNHPYLWDERPAPLPFTETAWTFAPRQFTPSLFKGGPCPPPSIMMRRGFLDRIGGWDKTIRGSGQDIEFALRASYYGTSAFLPRPLLRIRRHHGESASRDPLKTYLSVVQELERCSAHYDAELRAYTHRRLGGYFARVGWMLYAVGRYREAAAHYRRAIDYGGVGMAARVKYWIARCKA